MTMTDANETFRTEAAELLETLQAGLMELKQRPADLGLVDSVFRALHTIKGSGAMFGYTAAATFVHEFETVFDGVRKGRTPASPALIRIALGACDHIHALIQSPDASTAGGEPILAALRQAVGDGADEPVDAAVEPSASHSASGWKVRFRLPSDSLVLGTNPVLLLEELSAFGSCDVRALLGGVPELGALDPEASYLGWEVTLRADVPRESIEDVFMFLSMPSEDLVIAPLDAAGQDTTGSLDDGDDENIDSVGNAVPSKPRGAATGAGRSDGGNGASPARSFRIDKAGTSLRVPADRLDSLMDRVGELVIAQARLSQLASTSTDQNLKSVAEDMERLSASLRDTTMGIRMVPIGSLFGRFRRLVHDLSHDLGKEIDFVTHGEETELDKTMIEQLADPLVHLIRNAADHGLERPDVRLANGKSPTGTLRLSAVYAGAEVAISIADDGAGLDAERIRAKAAEAGLIAADQPITEPELFQLVFHPGFSTAREVTALSGRGVGMDVVKKTIEGLRGSIEIASTRGQATTVTLRLPLTLAIIDGLLVRVGDGRYTIPLAAVEECVELPPEADIASKGRSFLNVRGALVPFLRLRDLFGTDVPADLHPKVVIVSSGETRVGLVVDQIIGNNQTVIKQLSTLHAGLKNFSGATILGDGSVALILDVLNLVGSGQDSDESARSIGRAA
ncbi:chemotaxis protein CheA [Aquibium carbonis]|uniref:Chemotaxis protein CheA n=1 Tax=Aquibium carbonis TaxID=2495581 RepID=A0A429YV96_9HYPH|nr:chemotaxis protein CheA [Aquibium carbonis]RST85395.1 chemotaxis protein CheA [Aquibium carbonis]